jgi:sigma-B regulation protein RsbU (phosphoserine phosphatase)
VSTSILEHVDLFTRLPADVRSQLTDLLEEVSLGAGEALFHLGDPGEAMYILASGRLRVHHKQQTLNILEAGAVFGETSLLEQVPRTATVTAMEPSTLYRLHRDPFQQMLTTRGEVALALVREFSRRLHDHLYDLDRLKIQLEQEILPLGIALSTERDVDVLIERVLDEAKKLTRADAGTIYLRTKDDHLAFAIMKTDSLGIARGGGTGTPITLPPLPLRDPESGEENLDNIATYVTWKNHSVNISDVYATEDFDFSGAREYDTQLGYRAQSCLTTPLIDHKNRVIGVLQLFNAQTPQGEVVPFSEYHQLLVESLASQAAVVLNTQRLLNKQERLVAFQRDVQTGRRIQADFLPRNLPNLEGWEIAARFYPAREVAGDFYDVFPLASGNIAVVMADVCDKGVGSALFMALSRSLLRAYSGQLAGSQTPDAVLQAIHRTNDYITTNHASMYMFVTTFFGVLDPASGLLTYINAGHNPPMVIGAEGTVKNELMPTGPAVGMIAGAEFDTQWVSLAPGDLLFTYTDGVTEARSPMQSLFSDQRLLKLLQRTPISAADVVDRVERDVRAHMADAPAYDDITMMALRRLEG